VSMEQIETGPSIFSGKESVFSEREGDEGEVGNKNVLTVIVRGGTDKGRTQRIPKKIELSTDQKTFIGTNSELIGM